MKMFASLREPELWLTSALRPTPHGLAFTKKVMQRKGPLVDDGRAERGLGVADVLNQLPLIERLDLKGWQRLRLVKEFITGG